MLLKCSNEAHVDARFTMKTPIFSILTALYLLGSSLAPTLRADDKSLATAPAPFEVYPADVNLETSGDFQSIVARITRLDGITQDVTGEVKLELADPKLAAIEGNVLKPIADGQTQLKVTWHDQSLTIPVKVKDAAIVRPISFRLDVMPVFMRSGCNVGGCHGAARGKDGFHLSLFGYDPASDYNSLTRQITSRRINLALPQESLLLTKATGTVPHTGGERFKPNTPLYNTLLAWLKAGAPDDVEAVAKPTSLEILPKQIVLEEGTTQRMTVRAHYSDGTDRDVTKLVVFLSNNDTSAKFNEEGVVTAGTRGEAFVMARFATFTVGSQAIVVPKGLQYSFPSRHGKQLHRHAGERQAEKTAHRSVGVMQRRRLSSAGRTSTSAATCQRADEHDKFVADKDPQKREKLVDDLLSRKEFVDMWVMKWAELLQIRSDNQQVSYKNALLYYNWLEDKIEHNVPFDQIVQELLGANGGTFKNPATNYYQITTDTLKVSENAAQVFMGMRIQCAQCHNHPFDRWTMDDYYGFAAFFSQVGRKQAEDPREIIVFDRGGGEVESPGRRTRREAEIPRRRCSGREGQRPPDGPGQVAGIAGKSLLRQEPVEHRLVALLRQGDHRAGR